MLAGPAAHVVVLLASHTPPPPASLKNTAAPVHRDENGVLWAGSSFATRRGAIAFAQLEGDAAQIGRAHASLLYEPMLRTEQALWTAFDQVVPSSIARALILDIGRLRFRRLDRNLGPDRRKELAFAATAFGPDPFAGQMPTYQRFLTLHALYDISLSFEHSPLVGCSSVVVTGPRAAQGHTLLARNFDFETHPIFDEGKAVIVFRETGRIPVLSVAWPGLAGVVTGMNAEGVGLVVHGGRAGTWSSSGEPVVITMREALANGRTTDEVVQWIAHKQPMVSHLVLVADASGRTAVVERAPGHVDVRYTGEATALTNHFEGPMAADPANVRVREESSTLPRRARLDELLQALPPQVTATDLVRILRDRKAAGGLELPAGDRRAIDADIATHGVVMDLSARTIWVSEGPHLRGRFVAFDASHLEQGGYHTPETESSIP